MDWTGGGTVTLEDYPAASEAETEEDVEADQLEEDTADETEGTVAVPAAPATEVSAIRVGGRITPSPAAVAAAQEFWEAVGILPVEIVVPGAAGVTLRCYVEDVARFLGRNGEIFLFDTPMDLATFLSTSTEDHDLTEIASWPEVADTDTSPLPAEQDRYDLTELTEVLSEVADGAAGLVDHRAFAQPIEGVRDIAEYAGLKRVDELLSPSAPLGRAVARGERDPGATLPAEDATAIKRDWDEVVTAVTGALVWRD